MSRPFQVGDRVRVPAIWTFTVFRVRMAPNEWIGERYRLEGEDNVRTPWYAAPDEMELVEPVEARLARELMA